MFTLPEKVENSPDLGNRWTFTNLIPESSYLHTVHSGQRTQEEAQIFVEKIKENSDGQAPFFESDGWFYEQVLTIVYGFYLETTYKGRGRKPLPKWVADPQLKYAQVVKERQNGAIEPV